MRRSSILALAILPLVIPGIILGQTLADKVKEFTLDNGMKFVVVERPVAPVFFGAIAFNVGSINEWDGVTGISHLLEHMMFKGTTTVGTVSYAKEKKYLEKEDEIATSMRILKAHIGDWRLEIFDDFARGLISDLADDQKQRIGSEKAKELAVLISLLETGQHTPAQTEQHPTLMEDGGADYFEMYVDLKRNELELQHVLVEHRELIVKDELWDTYVQNGSRMLNAFTANDLTGYIVYLPSNRLELWMMLESDRIKNAVFREFYSERDVVAEERRLSENDPDDALGEALLATAFQASPYARPVLGWMSDIQSITREELIAYHRRFYAPNNATAILVGDVQVDTVEDLARRYFGRIRSQQSPDPVETIEPEQRGERRVTVEFPANPQVAIAYHVPVAPHPDSYPIHVLMAILGQGRTSRLYKRIYEELELTSRKPSVSSEPGEKMDNLLVIHAIPRHPHTSEEVEAAIYEEIDALKSEPPTEREIQRIRNSIDANMVRVLGSNLGIAFNLGFNAIIRGDWRAYLDDQERIKQVEAEDVSSVARKYLTPQNRTVATLVKVDEVSEEVGREAREGAGQEGAKGAGRAAGQAGEPEEVDIRALIEWVRTLPEEEQKEIFGKFQTMTQEERRQYAHELMQRMQPQAQ